MSPQLALLLTVLVLLNTWSAYHMGHSWGYRHRLEEELADRERLRAYKRDDGTHKLRSMNRAKFWDWCLTCNIPVKKGQVCKKRPAVDQGKKFGAHKVGVQDA
jgi:hypothetical protein